MRHVSHRVDALRAALCDVVVVGCDSELVRKRAIVVAPYPNVDMRGHVYQVAGARNHTSQSVGGSDSALWLLLLDSVNVEMIRTGMIGVVLQYEIERRKDLFGERLGFPVLGPVRPRHRIHHRFGEKRLNLEVVRKPSGDRSHRVGVRMVERRALRRWRCRVAGAKRLDQGAFLFARPGQPRFGLFQSLVGL